MRLLLLILCCLLCLQQLSAQQDFIQPGAQWHYNMKYGSFRQYVHSDTSIGGIICKSISTETYVDSLYFYYGFRVVPLPNEYIYSSNDTVYAYNGFWSKFKPLYVFNVQAGDRIKLPVWPQRSPHYLIPQGDSTVQLIIDSVKIELFDTAHLKTVYSHPDTANSMNLMAYGKYTWNIGGMSGLIPKCIQCPYFTKDDGTSQQPDSIRCYSDNRIAVKYVTGDCKKGISLSVLSKRQEDNISIHPNPATKTVYITNNSLTTISKAIITGMDGRVYKRCEQEIPAEISIKEMPAGTYILRLQTTDGSTFTKKLVIVK